MKKIGITGGIGSGKSTVGKILEALNYPVYYSDYRAKELMECDASIKNDLINLLGMEVYSKGKLNRPFLANRLFLDDALRLKINGIIHPKVREDFNNWAERQHSALVFNEAAILFETGSYKTLDKTILVVAPEKMKIQRIIERDNCTEKEVCERMSKQMSDQEKMPLADFVLVNDEQHSLIQQIEKIIEEVGQ